MNPVVPTFKIQCKTTTEAKPRAGGVTRQDTDTQDVHKTKERFFLNFSYSALPGAIGSHPNFSLSQTEGNQQRESRSRVDVRQDLWAPVETELCPTPPGGISGGTIPPVSSHQGNDHRHPAPKTRAILTQPEGSAGCSPGSYRGP